MNYVEARSRIADGDLIGVRGKHGLFAAFTRYFTRSDYTHVGIAFWMAGGLWMAEINGGRNHAVPMSQLAGCDFDVFFCPEHIQPTIADAVQVGMRAPIDYGFLSIPVIGFINYFKIKVSLNARRVLSCAGYCVMIYELAGWPRHTRVLSPADLVRRLVLKCTVTGDESLLDSPLKRKIA